MIYEGTNEIQALDLVQRKVLDDGGARLEVLLDTLEQDEARSTSDPRLADFATALRDQLASVRRATRELVSGRLRGSRVAAERRRRLSTRPWLRAARLGMGTVGAIAFRRTRTTSWYRDKLRAARFGLQWLLPEGDLCWRRVLARDALVPSAAE